MAKWDLPPDPVIAAKVVEHEARKAERREEIGMVGRLFGAAGEKAGNIAGFAVVVFSSILGCVLIFGTDTTSLSKKDAVTIVAGLLTLSLGFVFGRTTS